MSSSLLLLYLGPTSASSLSLASGLSPSSLTNRLTLTLRLAGCQASPPGGRGRGERGQRGEGEEGGDGIGDGTQEERGEKREGMRREKTEREGRRRKGRGGGKDTRKRCEGRLELFLNDDNSCSA